MPSAIYIAFIVAILIIAALSISLFIFSGRTRSQTKQLKSDLLVANQALAGKKKALIAGIRREADLIKANRR